MTPSSPFSSVLLGLVLSASLARLSAEDGRPAELQVTAQRATDP